MDGLHIGGLSIGVAKLITTVLASGVGFPGGVIFPLFYAAAALAQGGSSANLLSA
mgnify:CR=1 FL=1